MKTLDPALAGHIAEGVTTLCWCWRVDRKDGEAMGFTDHDRPLTFDSLTFEAASGFNATAIEDQLGLAVSNLDVSGALSSDAITEADLNAGRYDDAQVTIYRVNWADPSQRVIMRKGWLGQMRRGKVAFETELRGLASRLDQVSGRMLQRTCSWTHGDARCGRDLTAPGAFGSGEVITVSSAFEFTADGLDAFASGFFTRGRLTWTSGDNEGLDVELTAHVLEGTTARMKIMLPMGFPVAVGDTFTVTQGCDNTFTACIAKANAENFGGFPHMPGNDFAVTYARQGDNNDGGKRT